MSTPDVYHGYIPHQYIMACQAALKEFGLYHGRLTGVIDEYTISCIRSYYGMKGMGAGSELSSRYSPYGSSITLRPDGENIAEVYNAILPILKEAYPEDHLRVHSTKLGQTNRDVEKIIEQFQKSVDVLTEYGRRRPGKGLWNGIKNNAKYWCGSRCGNTYFGCKGQAAWLKEDLENLELEGEWRFQTITNIIHFWVVASSPDPNDPYYIKLDPWRGTYEIWPTTSRPLITGEFDVD